MNRTQRIVIVAASVLFVVVVGTTFLIPAIARSSSAAPADKVSYALGTSLGAEFRTKGITVDPQQFLEGFTAALAGKKGRLSETEVRAVLTSMGRESRTKQIAAVRDLMAKNLKASDAFLTANKTKPGVVTLESGLQYKVLTAGTGRKPTLADTVVCNYRGTLADGTEFDNSYKKREPATLPVERLVKGWAEAIQLMPTGSKWQIFLPPNLAYGGRGAGNIIGPNTALVFEVELLSIKDKV